LDTSKLAFFLNFFELISDYNPLFKQHIETHKKGSVHYLSPAVQNEFITLLANLVRSEIITRAKNAKYYYLFFDCAPDSSHKEQMSEILIYIYITEGRVTIEKSFVDFISTHGKTGLGLSTEILNRIEQDGLYIKKREGSRTIIVPIFQQGLQARILQVNEVAKFIPCSAHSLNLSSCHAAQVSSDMTTFFGTVQWFVVVFLFLRPDGAF
jgi:hypothetical protein